MDYYSGASLEHMRQDRRNAEDRIKRDRELIAELDLKIAVAEAAERAPEEVEQVAETQALT